MEPITLSTMVVGFLSPYLAKAGETIAKKAGEAAWEKMKDIHEIVKNKLAGDDYAGQTLKRLEEVPESETRQAALTGILEEKIRDDSTFAETLQKLLREVKEAGVEQKIVQQMNVSDHGKVEGDVVQIGKVKGNVDLSKKNKDR